MLEVLNEDYIRTARAKGLSAPRVVVIHALRNALIPVVTVIGLQVGSLLSGAILTETIFAWPGVGHWLVESVQRRDYPVVQGGVLLIATLVMLVNLGVDLTYGMLNPTDPALMSDAAIATPAAAPMPGQAAAVLAIVRGEPRRGAGAFRDGGADPARGVRRCRGAAFADRAIPRPFPHAADVAAGRDCRVPARHRRCRPRRAGAPDLRRAAVAADRHRGGHAVAVLRHRAGPDRGVRRRPGRHRDHAADGRRAGVPQPAAGDRDRRHPRTRPVQRDDRGRRRDAAQLHAPYRAPPRCRNWRATTSPRRAVPVPARCT